MDVIKNREKKITPAPVGTGLIWTLFGLGLSIRPSFFDIFLKIKKNNIEIKNRINDVKNRLVW